MRTPTNRKLYLRISNDEFTRLLRILGAEGQALFFIDEKNMLLSYDEQYLSAGNQS